MDSGEILIPITLFVSTAAVIFGLRYMANKERMAMIEKGIDLGVKKAQPQPYVVLKWGLLLIGAGLGLFIAFTLDHTIFKQTGDQWGHNDANVAIYFSMISIFGGLGLFTSYLIEKKETLDK